MVFYEKKEEKIEKKAKIIVKIYWNKYLSFLDIYKWLKNSAIKIQKNS